MNTEKFTLKDSLGATWIDFKNNLWFLVGITAAFFLVGFVMNSITGALKSQGMFVLLALMYVVSYLVNALLAIGLIAITLKIIKKEETGWKELISHTDILISYVLASLLFGFGVAFGFILLIAPGCILLAMYYFYAYGMIDKKLKIIESFKYSAKITKGVRWKLFGIFIALGVFNFIGVIAAFIGLLITYPLTLLITAHIYKSLSDGNSEHEETEVVVQPQELPAQ